MRATDLTDLLEVVEAVRKKKHPDLPAELVRDVVLLEEKHGEDEGATLQALRERLEHFANLAGDGGGG